MLSTNQKSDMRGRRRARAARRWRLRQGVRAEEGGGDYQDGLHLGLEEEGEQGRRVARRWSPPQGVRADAGGGDDRDGLHLGLKEEGE